MKLRCVFVFRSKFYVKRSNGIILNYPLDIQKPDYCLSTSTIKYINIRSLDRQSNWVADLCDGSLNNN